MTVRFLAWLLMGGGLYLMVCSVQNRSPKDTLVSVLQGKQPSNEPWHPLPGYAYWVNPANEQVVEGVGSSVGGVVGGAVSGNRRQAVIDFAMQQLGEPYVFGASGPDSWDCSGLTQKAYRSVGIKLPHHAASQGKMGTAVSEANAQPGDLVFWGPISGHTAIYLGNGKVIHAPHTGDVVKVANIWGRNRRFRSFL